MISDILHGPVNASCSSLSFCFGEWIVLLVYCTSPKFSWLYQDKYRGRRNLSVNFPPRCHPIAASLIKNLLNSISTPTCIVQKTRQLFCSARYRQCEVLECQEWIVACNRKLARKVTSCRLFTYGKSPLSGKVVTGPRPSAWVKDH